MLKFGHVAVLVLLLLAPVGLIADEQESVAHYRFGDNSRWADPSVDDSSWPVAQEGRWPRPALYSDGFIWVRFRAPVRTDIAEPLALQVSSLPNALIAYEVFVNGTLVGSFGRVPPNQFVESLPRAAVFDLSRGLTGPGKMAQVTLRAWYPPAVRRIGRFDGAILEFDASRTLNAKETTVREQALLRNVPLMMLDGVILLLGCTVLLFGYSSRSRDVLLCGSMIATLPLLPFFLQIVDSRLVVFSVPVYFPLQAIAQIPSMTASVVFIWAINDFSDVLFKRLMFAAMIVFNLAMLLAFMPAKPSPAMSLALATYPFALRAFDVINVGANLWAVFTLRRNRPIAVAMMLIPAASLIGGFRTSFQGQGTKFFDLAFLIFGLYLSAVLAQRAWKEWRTRDTLQAEFETAREMQQRLVGPAVDVPGFRIESVYKPATHVGGDFFYIRAEEQNAVLVVVGDVSGKGLKAAMTVNLVIGALRTMPLLPPTRILTALNRGLVGQMQGGFVTCCAVRIGPDGNAALANAGHLSPYLDGVEVPVNAGLPLGIHGGSEYEESHFVLEPAGYLTFLSDGIVEARSTSGELFGFERTQAISTQSAEEIARAAQEFGQEDDITVLTLTFAPAEVVRA